MFYVYLFPSAFANCSTRLTQLTTKSKKIDIPDGFLIDNDNNVTFIYVKQDILEVTGDITIPDGVTEIPGYAFFYFSSLENITIPDSVISIESDAFEVCRSLKSVIFGENSNLTIIGAVAFYNCGYYDNIALLTLDIPNSVTTIEEDAFKNVNNINISAEQKELKGYHWGALHVNGVAP